LQEELAQAKKGWEGVNIFLVWMVHRVTFKGEDYIIDA
jgi:hypothetical protein